MGEPAWSRFTEARSCLSCPPACPRDHRRARARNRAGKKRARDRGGGSRLPAVGPTSALPRWRRTAGTARRNRRDAWRGVCVWPQHQSPPPHAEGRTGASRAATAHCTICRGESPRRAPSASGARSARAGARRALRRAASARRARKTRERAGGPARPHLRSEKTEGSICSCAHARDTPGTTRKRARRGASGEGASPARGTRPTAHRAGSTGQPAVRLPIPSTEAWSPLLGAGNQSARVGLFIAIGALVCCRQAKPFTQCVFN